MVQDYIAAKRSNHRALFADTPDFHERVALSDSAAETVGTREL